VSEKSKIVIFMGPPGSGKGSVARLCVEKLGFKQLSTGNLCRKQIQEQTEIGKRIDFFIKSGKLVPDGIIIEMVGQWLVERFESNENVILDGYPRTVAQAEALDSLLQENFSGIVPAIFELVVPDSVVVDRLCQRYICQDSSCQAAYSMIEGSSLRPKRDMVCDLCSAPLKRRSDDTREAIEQRLKIHHEHEKNLLQFYKDRGQKIFALDAEKPLNEVFEDFKRLIGIDDL